MADIIVEALEGLERQLGRVNIQRDLLTGRLYRLDREIRFSPRIRIGVSRWLVKNELEKLGHKANQLEIAIWDLQRQ